MYKTPGAMSAPSSQTIVSIRGQLPCAKHTEILAHWLEDRVEVGARSGSGDGRYCSPWTVTGAYSRFPLSGLAWLSPKPEEARSLFERLFHEYGWPEATRPLERHQSAQPACFDRSCRESNEARPHEALAYGAPAAVYRTSPARAGLPKPRPGASGQERWDLWLPDAPALPQRHAATEGHRLRGDRRWHLVPQLLRRPAGPPRCAGLQTVRLKSVMAVAGLNGHQCSRLPHCETIMPSDSQ